MVQDWLNYHHLLYFWTIAREGGVSKAAVRLRLSQPTVTARIRELERSLGTPLFLRTSRGVQLTAEGATFDDVEFLGEPDERFR